VIGATGPAALRGIADAAARQHDALPWYASRILAILAYLALAGSVVYGLLMSTKLLDAIAHRPISFALHQDLAAVGLGLAGIHGALLALDRTVPMPLLQLAVPFAAPYRAPWVGAGQIAFYVMLTVVASFYVRRHIGQRAWRLLHYATFLSFAGATAHGIMAGSDSGTAWASWMYIGATVAVVFLFAYRVVTGLAIARARRARALDAADTDPANAPRPVPVRRAA
jgi:predicted ferric reductase